MRLSQPTDPAPEDPQDNPPTVEGLVPMPSKDAEEGRLPQPDPAAQPPIPLPEEEEDAPGLVDPRPHLPGPDL